MQLQPYSFHLKTMLYNSEGSSVVFKNRVKWNLVYTPPCFINCLSGFIMGPRITLQKKMYPIRVNNNGKGTTLPGHPDFRQGVA